MTSIQHIFWLYLDNPTRQMERVTCALSLYHILCTDILRGKALQKENIKVLSDTMSTGQLCQSCDIFPVGRVFVSNRESAACCFY